MASKSRKQRRAAARQRRIAEREQQGHPGAIAIAQRKRNRHDPQVIEERRREFEARKLGRLVKVEATANKNEGTLIGPLVVAAREAAPGVCVRMGLDGDEHVFAVENWLITRWGDDIDFPDPIAYRDWRVRCERVAASAQQVEPGAAEDVLVGEEGDVPQGASLDGEAVGDDRADRDLLPDLDSPEEGLELGAGEGGVVQREVVADQDDGGTNELDVGEPLVPEVVVAGARIERGGVGDDNGSGHAADPTPLCSVCEDREAMGPGGPCPECELLEQQEGC